MEYKQPTISPTCIDCERREPGCHSRCQIYQKAKREYDTAQARIRKKKEERSLAGYTKESQMRREKKSSRKDWALTKFY